ncbi:MAG: hypothetical protein J1F23_00130 [Oscillospiraceae bacterium]|nr:hypothetical protein [Oscillospiraceae bacterium]
MKNLSVYRQMIKCFSEIKRKYKRILKSKAVKDTDIAFFDNYYLIERHIGALKNDIRRCRKELNKNRELFMLLCAASEDGEKLDDSIILNILRGINADYSKVFLTETVVKCAAVRKISLGAEDAEKGIEILREIRDIDFRKLFEICESERLAQKYEDFKISDSETKMLYRRKIYEKSKKEGKTTCEFLKNICENKTGAYLGEYLFKKRQCGELSLAVEIMLPVFLSIGVALALNSPWTGLFLFLPFWQIVSVITVNISMLIFRPDELPRVKKEYLTSENCRTLIAVSVLLTDENSLCDMEKHIEKLYFSNCNENISLCILADLKGSKNKNDSNDEKILAGIEKSFRKINEKCGNNVLCCVRPRVYSKTQDEYMGRDRKRGAIEDLVCSLKEGTDPFLRIFGKAALPKDVKYILALDSDTDPTLDCTEELLQTALHPVNREKYGVFTMRTEVDVECTDSTVFSRLCAGDGGITAYHSGVAERYQDIFKESVFSGKGLISVDGFYDKCCQKFKPETVLSHDILEGELLKTAYVSHCQALDLFPTNQVSYLKRLHRWVRGDWQNSVFIFSSRPFAKRDDKNNLTFLSRFKLFDNLRRSITPLAALICIVLSGFLPSRLSAVLFVTAILCLGANDIASFIRLLLLPHGGFFRRFYSGNIPLGLYPLVRFAIGFVMLPAEALVSFDGAVKGLYRRLVTKKNMLLWTTAQQGERSSKTVSELIYLLPNIICAVALLFSFHPWGTLSAIFFILNIPFCLLSGKKRKKRRATVDYLTKEQLIADGKRMWEYYADFANAENNYLPPDNVQFSPVYRVAHRTSPTNIGLMMVSVSVAYDLKYIDLDVACRFLENTLNTIDRMEKFNGNLYNWYDTKTLRPLMPRFVSTVDSGNLLCALTALKSWLTDFEGNERVNNIADRVGKIIRDTDISFLYNKNNGLMHIGYDAEKGEKTNSYYDLLMSEARMTSYFAVASRRVPRKHWETLGRHLARYKGYSGPVSWTGTMFEYFMPNIFLPSYKNTLEYEGLKFCLSCQKSYGREHKIPFGVSESGFYDFDAMMNYQYKAHGVDRLGLKRDIPAEKTVSPYSTYLVLPFDQKSALRNLRELKKTGAYGKYGLFEALDYTPERTLGQEKMIVKSFMAHHIGMSILSIDNAINGNVMQKRFMADSEQMTAESLLRERVPNRPFSKNERRKKAHTRNIAIKYSPVKRAENIGKYADICGAYTNGEYTCVCGDNGWQTSVFGENTVLGIMKNPSVGENGIYAQIKIQNGRHPFTRNSDFYKNGYFSAVFGENKVRFFSSSLMGDGEKEVSVHPDKNCETHSFSFKPNCRADGFAEIYFQPVLCQVSSYLSHRAFAKLFVTAQKDGSNNCIIFKYTFRDKNESIYCCVGTDSDNTFFDLAREDVLSRGREDVFLNFDELTERLEGVPDTCVAIKIPVSLKKGKEIKFRLAVAVGKSVDEAVEAYKAGFTDFRGAKSIYPVSGRSRELYFKTATAVSSESAVPTEKAEILKNTACSRADIWKYGISGDIPLAVFFADGKNMQTAQDAAKIVTALYRAGIRCELAIICREKDNYGRAVENGLLKAIGRSPAVHFINGNSLAKEDENKLLCFACTCNRWENIPNTDNGIDITYSEEGKAIDGGIYSVPADTPLPWSWILAGEKFGTLISNNSLGYTYYGNSQENKITPWINDTRGIGGERLYAFIDGKTVDIIDNSRMTLYPQSVAYTSAVRLNSFTDKNPVKEMHFTTKITLNGSSKNIEVTAEGTEKTIEIAYCIDPVLDDRKRFPQFIKAYAESGKVVFENTLKNDGMKYFIGCENGQPVFAESQLYGDKENDFSPSENPFLGMKTSLGNPQTAVFTLGVCDSEQGIAHETSKITVTTPDECLNKLYNDFLPVQILCGRLFGRTSFYQCSGAYGFRDQLQDALSVIPLCPTAVRDIIIKCAGAQFPEGDVLHWFHIENNGNLRGVRTRYSDDLLWLIMTTAEYCRTTGDIGILSEQIPFLTGEPLGENDAERYGAFSPSNESATLLEHCEKVFEKAFRTGEHSLILMGGGDWNDGFNKIGEGGRGESVFTSQLAIICGEELCTLLELAGQKDKTEAIRQKVKALRDALEQYAFYNDRYIRCFLDNGTALGVPECKSCKIDSLTQSFAVFSGLNGERCKEALNTAWNELVDENHCVVRLFAPSFCEKDENIGYITAYPEGIRENGGQYTHSAVWLARAMLKNSQTGRGLQILKMLNPLEKYKNGLSGEYKTEPYFLTGDVYYRKGLEGRGGWSLYTGSASWYYKTVTEDLLGITARGDKLYFTPKAEEILPFSAELQIFGTKITLSAEKNGKQLYCDGVKSEFIPLDGKTHTGNYSN